jgi:hypothetical protein
MNKTNVGSIQNLNKTLAPHKILSRNIRYVLDAGLFSCKWLLSPEDLQYLDQCGYKYEPISDPIYPVGVYIVRLDKALE